MPIDLTPIVKPLNDLAEPLTTSISDAWSALLGDRVAAWRLRNAAATQVKLHEELKRLGVSLDNAKIPERYAFAWFDEATKQDEPEIQELFARLLAKAAAGDKDAGDRRNLEILTRMTPMDAEVMNLVFHRLSASPRTPYLDEYELWKGLRDDHGDKGTLSFEHLVTLGLIERNYAVSKENQFSWWDTVDPNMKLAQLVAHVNESLKIDCDISATERGLVLFNACSVSDKPPS
jgi:hypothetical protein